MSKTTTKARRSKVDSISAMLRAMPIDKRAETIVDIFRIIAAEFAAMVLEHVKPPKPPRKARRRKIDTAAGDRGRPPQ
jgi:hypothetical protein